ncbi:MAG: MASE3 domain-containing protein [Dehalogenimonas sp.]
MIIGLVGFLLILLARSHSYLLFHSVAEIFSIAIAFAIFGYVWNVRHSLPNNYLKLVGLSFFSYSVLIMMHLLTYKGMGIFPDDSNVPTQLWIASHYLIAFTFFLAPLVQNKRTNSWLVFIGYSVILVLLLLSIFIWKIFPVCYIEEVGLTSFKITSEYIISGMLLVSVGLLWRRRTQFDSNALALIISAIFVVIFGEIAFTLYIGVYDSVNTVGHLFSVLALYLLYEAVIVTGLREPTKLLYTVLDAKNKALERKTMELEKALSQVNSLSGLIPICSSCKKIRDDSGYWEAVESYISSHSEAEFSHGICPDCMRNLYPDIADEVLNSDL